MNGATATLTVLLLAPLVLASAAARAEERSPDAQPAAAQPLRAQLSLLAKARLSAPAARSVDELGTLLGEAQERARSGRSDEALVSLLAAVEGPRFRDFESLETFAAAELTLCRLLLEAGALPSAQRMAERLLARGSSTPSFGPAHRCAVDLALARGDHGASALRLRAQVAGKLPSDAESELQYLEALAAEARGELEAADRALSRVDPRSRFHAQARYLRGMFAAARGDFERAGQQFRSLGKLAREAPTAYLATAQLAEVEDAARLGLARMAHERTRPQLAFAHYFRVPNDSSQLPDALFEAAYASYERGELALALDSLAQLAARYPDSVRSAEAGVLRGYVYLGLGQFVRAEQELELFAQRFGAALDALDQLLASRSAARALFAQGTRESGLAPPRDRTLAALIARDPELERLRATRQRLDDELARSRGTGPALALLARRVRAGELPSARAPEPAEASDPDARIRKLSDQLARAELALASFARSLRELQRKPSDELRALTALLRTLEARREQAANALRQLLQARAQRPAAPASAGELGPRLEQDGAYVSAVQRRGLLLRAELDAALERAELRALRALRERLTAELRRARIAQIDAVMGKQRALEREIESLAAGRYPPEHVRPQHTPRLLRDDEEYWPFEGEDWPDEHESAP